MTNSDAYPALPESTNEGKYRYMHALTGTVIDMAISGCRVHVHLSAQFIFLNNVIQRSGRKPNAKTIEVEMCVLNDRQCEEARNPTAVELVVNVQSVPNDMQVETLQSLFVSKRSNGQSTLLISLTAGACPMSETKFPWVYGFDFSLNHYGMGDERASCMVFSRNYIPVPEKGPDSAEQALKNYEKFRVDAFVILGSQRLIQLSYDKLRMWRRAAVGYKHDT